MKCPKCNTENENGAKFCAGCGSSMSNLINTNRNNMPNNNLSLKKNRKNVRKKIITICACVLASLIVVGGVGILIYASKYAGTISYDDGATLIDKRALVADTPTSNFSITEADDDTLKIRSKESSVDEEDIAFNENLDNLQIGSVITSGPSEIAPYGMLRKVDGITRNPDGTISLSTSPAKIIDIVRKCDVTVNTVKNEDGTTSNVQSNNKNSFAGLFAEKAYATGIGVSGESFGADLSSFPHVDSGFSMNPNCHLAVDGDQVDFEVTINPTYNFSVGLESGLSLSYNKALAEIPLGETPIFIGPIHIPLIHKLTPSLGFGASISEDISMNLEFSFGRKLGFHYSTGGGCSGINDNTSQDPSLVIYPQTTSSIGFSVAPGLTLSSKLFDIAGGVITIQLKHSLNVGIKTLSPSDDPGNALYLPGCGTP